MTTPRSRPAGRAAGTASPPSECGITLGFATRGTRLATPAAAVALAALLIYLALTPLPPFARDVYGSLTRRYVVLGAVLLGYLGWLALERRLPRRTPLDLPLAAVTVALLFAVARSLSPRVSLEAVLPLLPAFVLFYLLHDLRALDTRTLARSVVAAVGIVAAVALAPVWRSLDEWWTLVRAVEGGVSREMLLPPATPRITGVGNHPNILATLFAMALPAALVAWVVARGRWERAGIALGAAVTVLALFFTLSRSAWLAAGAGVALTLLGLAIPASGRIRVSRRLLAGAAVAATLLALPIVAILASGARPAWLFRDSLGPRADMRRAGIEIFRDNPLTGAGPGLFTALYPLHDGAHPFAAVHTHNVVAQTLADTGIVGALAGTSLAVTVAYLILRGFRRGTTARRREIAAATGMLSAFTVHALAESPQLFPEALLPAVVALVILCRGSTLTSGELALTPGDLALTPQPPLPITGEGVPTSPPTPLRHGEGSLIQPSVSLGTPLPLLGEGPGVRANSREVRAAAATPPQKSVQRLTSLPAILAVTLAVTLPLAWLITSRAHAAHDRGMDAARAGRWPEAAAAAERALERDGRMPAYWFQLGAAHASAAVEGERRVEQEAALAAIQRGLELEPHNGAALVNYAALNVALGRPAVARETLPALGRLAGRDSLLLLAHATLTQWTAPPEEAVERYAGLLVVNPTLAATPFWEDGSFRAASFERIVERALARVPEVAGEGPAAASLRTAIEVYAGRAAPSLPQLEAALSARPDDTALQIAAGRLLMDAEATRPRAHDLLRAAVRRTGDDPTARAALGDWYALSGDTTRARREWTRAARLGSLPAAVALGNSYPDGAAPGPVIERAETLLNGAELTRFYLLFQTFRFTFQREEPVPIILPGDWLTAFPAELPAWRAAVDGWTR